MQYRRAKTPGGTYFFTVATHCRKRFLAQPDNVALLREAFRDVLQHHPFQIDAAVILPDHLHCLWALPPGDADFSTRWRLIKSYFSRVGWVSVYYRFLLRTRQHKGSLSP